MPPLTVGSLFAGIGGFDLGLERAGMQVRWQAENNPFSQHILNKHWPDVPCYGDIREVRGEEVEPVDVLCGGFPCQDISNAGLRAGIEGARSSLWKEIARLVGELRPRYLVVENVAALRRRGLDAVLSDLAALGYDAEWDGLRASDFGAPHRRDRIWIVAYPSSQGRRQDAGRASGDEEQAGRPQADHEPCGDGARRVSCGCGPSSVAGAVADADTLGRDGRPRIFGPGRWGESEDGRTGLAAAWTIEPDVGRVANGVPARVDRLTGLGNALVPQIAEWIGRRIVADAGA
jgi:DNA (cytosine-5)-methyltransferase 1